METKLELSKLNLFKEEIVAWYVLPCARKEVCRILVKESHYSQKETARILEKTEGAVSQYMNDKRANIIELDKKDKFNIQKELKGLKVEDYVKKAKEVIYKMLIEK